MQRLTAYDVYVGYESTCLIAVFAYDGVCDFAPGVKLKVGLGATKSWCSAVVVSALGGF